MVRCRNLKYFDKRRIKVRRGLFFCVKFSFAAFWQAGQGSFGWPFLLSRYSYPCSVCHHYRRKFWCQFLNRQKGQQMKTFASLHSCTQKIVKEHTSIYDLQTYLLQQRKIKSQKRFKNFKSALTDLMCFSLFLLYLK